MDILIKGLEMPKDDALSVIIYPDGVVEVQVGWNGDIPVYSNAFKATAIPVPKHGQLIDRDAVLKEYNQVGYMWQEVPRIAHEELVHIVYNAPVVLERTT